MQLWGSSGPIGNSFFSITQLEVSQMITDIISLSKRRIRNHNVYPYNLNQSRTVAYHWIKLQKQERVQS